MLIAIDFDGTIVNGDKPLPGAREAINNMREQGHYVMIFSCNNTEWIKRVCRENDIRYDEVCEGTKKPIAHVYIDDRAIAFRGDWEAAQREVEEAAEFKSTLHNGGLW